VNLWGKVKRDIERINNDAEGLKTRRAYTQSITFRFCLILTDERQKAKDRECRMLRIVVTFYNSIESD
jgi:hypothetical protein